MSTGSASLSPSFLTFESRVHPLVYPSAADAKSSSYLCNGLSVALLCPLDGATNRLKVHFQPGRPPRRLYFLST